MWLGSLREKRKILTARISSLNFITRWTLKAVLFVFGGLIRIEHRERLAACPWPVIFALNHNNYSETVLVPAALVYLCGGKITSFLVHWMFKVLPVINWFLKQIDPIWIYNRRVRFAWMRRRKPRLRGDIFAQALLRCKNNRSIGIFPEGTRNKNPRTLKRGRLGIGRIVLETGLPVVPVGIGFPGRVRRRKIPVIGRVIIRVGRPLLFSQERREAAGLQRETAGLKDEADFGREAANLRHGAADFGPEADRFKEEETPGLRQDASLSAVRRHAGLFRLYSRITHRVMVEISKLCGKRYPYSQGL
jgi:1-acyl-sn-glycerol-3-phosphate acyltransferase